MIVVWIIFIWVVGALLYGVVSVLRQARRDASQRRPPSPEPTAGESSPQDEPDHSEPN